MTSHPWLSPSAAVAAKVSRARATAALRQLGTIPLHRVGARWPGWTPLLAALPALLRADSGRVLDAVARVDVLSVLLELADGNVAADRVERALITLWLALAGHPGLTSPLALPGPFSERVVDPGAPRIVALAEVRGLIATAQGPVVIGPAGRLALDKFVVAPLPSADGTVIVDDRLSPPDPKVAARVRAALVQVRSALPGGRLERVTIGAGDAAYGEARVGVDADPADLVASAQAAFVRTAAAAEPVLGPGGVLVEQGQRLAAGDVLTRACGGAAALVWRANRAAAASAIAADLDDLAVLAEPTATGASLMAAIRALAGEGSEDRRRALLVNVDADDFVYSFQFGRSVERRCVEHGLRVDRITIDPSWRRDLVAELGEPIPPPIADGTEVFVHSEDDPSLAAALRRLATRRYEVVVANVRPKLFYDLVATGLLAARTLVWDRHLHDGLEEERARRGVGVDYVHRLPIRVWSLQGTSGPDLHRSLVDAGLADGWGRPWPMDCEFFQSTVTRNPDRLFAGGDSGRDWPLFAEAIRGLPLDVHLVTRQAPAELTSAQLAPGGRVHVDPRLPLWRFRDAMAAAAITAIPIVPGVGASGLTVLTMAMALGVAVVATETSWITQYVTHEEEALLTPPGDVAAFRTALIRLHEQADLRERLVANARRRVAALCDLEAFTREMFATLG